MEAGIRFVEPDKVQVIRAIWPVEVDRERYGVLVYRSGEKVVLYGDSERKAVWEAATKSRDGWWVGAVVDIQARRIVAQELSSDQPGYVDSFGDLVQPKRAWERRGRDES